MSVLMHALRLESTGSAAAGTRSVDEHQVWGPTLSRVFLRVRLPR